jgi:hypothetical protein
MYILNKIERHNLFYLYFLLWLFEFQFNPLLKKCNWNGNLSLDGKIMQKNNNNNLRIKLGILKKSTIPIHSHSNSNM